MSERLRHLLTIGLVLISIGILALMIQKIQAGTQQMIRDKRRLLLSTALVVNPEADLYRVVDGNPKTALPNLNHLEAYPQAFPWKRTLPNSWNFHLDRPFFQVDVGLTHFPGDPPVANPLRFVRIWAGYQKDKRTWKAYARPKNIQLLFFRQRLVDSDREYRIIGEPKLWQTLFIELKDHFGPQDISLDFGTKIPVSKGFPHNIDLIWCRLEILDYYPGSHPAHKDSLALSELEFFFRIPVPSQSDVAIDL